MLESRADHGVHDVAPAMVRSCGACEGSPNFWDAPPLHARRQQQLCPRSRLPAQPPPLQQRCAPHARPRLQLLPPPRRHWLYAGRLKVMDWLGCTNWHHIRKGKNLGSDTKCYRRHKFRADFSLLLNHSNYGGFFFTSYKTKWFA